MRCPDCNKFVSYDTDAEPEEDSQEVEGTSFKAQYRRVLNCADCGTELKSADIELEYEFEGEITESETRDAEYRGFVLAIAQPDGSSKYYGPKTIPVDTTEEGMRFDTEADAGVEKEYLRNSGYFDRLSVVPVHEHEFEVETCDAEGTERVQDTDDKGRKIKSARYMKTFYGVSLTVEVKCECGATAEFNVENDEQASSFEEC